jgi:hypothetical protein
VNKIYGDMRNTFKGLVGEFKKRPLGKPGCKGGILLKDLYIYIYIYIYKTGYICIFRFCLISICYKNYSNERPEHGTAKE